MNVKKIRIKERLKEIGKSQGWLASYSGLKKEYVSSLATGRIKNPHLLTLIKISRALRCSIEDIWII